MIRDNIRALVMAVTLVASVIAGFTICISDLSLNQVWSVQQQKDKGLVVDGVHSPEFEFEKKMTL